MKRNLFLVLAIIIGLAVSSCFSAPPAQQAASPLPVVTVVNSTGYKGYYLYLSPSSADDWEEELLGDKILNNGESYRVRLAYPLSRENVYDFKLVDSDGDSYIKWRIRLSENSTVTFVFNDIVLD